MHRLKDTLNSRKPAIWVIILLVLLAAALCAVLVLRPAAEPAGRLKANDGAKAELTLEDVRVLARRGSALTFEDFNPFLGGDASSSMNYHIMLYGVEKRYRLIVRTDGKTIDAANLESIWESGGTGIDIRTGDIDRFAKEHPSYPAPSGPGKVMLDTTAPKWSPEQAADVILMSLDFASEDIVIFHGIMGLFVYDLHSKQLIRSIDLQPINCQWTQGSDACEVTVSLDGSIVQLHPANNKNMFVYSVSDGALYESAAYKPMEYRFSSTVPTEEVMKLGPVSPRVVTFGAGDYSYLYSPDWTLGKLSYIRGNTQYPLFN